MVGLSPDGIAELDFASEFDSCLRSSCSSHLTSTLTTAVMDRERSPSSQVSFCTFSRVDRADSPSPQAVTTFDSGHGSSTVVGGQSIRMEERYSMDDFLQEVDDVRTQIQQLRRSAQSLESLNTSTSLAAGSSQLGTSDAQRLSHEATELSTQIRQRIVEMAARNRRSAVGDPSFEVRKKQVEGLQAAFKRALEELFAVEKEARRRARERLERQYQIVKPQATQEELDEALSGSLEGRQIFAEAVSLVSVGSRRSNRS